MWTSEKERKRAVLKNEVESLKKEIIEAQIEPLLTRINIDYTKKDGLSLEIPFIDDTVLLQIPSFAFKKSGGGIVETPLKAIILSYLKNLVLISEDESEDFVNLEDLGISVKETAKSLKKAFAYDAKGFLACGAAIGGQSVAHKDGSMLFPILPGVRFLFVLKEAEEEKDAELEIHVPKKAIDIFSSSQLIYIIKTMVRKIFKRARKAFSEYSF